MEDGTRDRSDDMPLRLESVGRADGVTADSRCGGAGAHEHW